MSAVTVENVPEVATASPTVRVLLPKSRSPSRFMPPIVTVPIVTMSPTQPDVHVTVKLEKKEMPPRAGV
jgi:hypothetical protein